MSLEEAQDLISSLKALISTSDPIEPELGMHIFEKCTEFIEAHRDANSSLANLFNARFHLNFQYRFSPNESINASDKVAAFLVQLGRYDEAIKSLREIKAVKGQPITSTS